MNGIFIAFGGVDGKEKMDSLIQTGRKSIVAIGGAD